MGSVLSSRMKSQAKKAPEEEKSLVIEISTIPDWQPYLTNRLTLVDFSASWCGPSNFLEPQLNTLASQYTNVVRFIKIDVDAHKLKSVVNQFNVEAVPTLVLLKQGKEVARFVGANIEEIKKMINKEVEAPKPVT